LQPRFEQRQRKRVFRLMSHPRFRAAFDFLELRAIEDPSLADEAAWWRDAQTLPSEKLAERLQPGKARASDAGPAAGPVADKPKRRRRRRRGGKSGGSEASTEAAD
jgi:poly(A) polymerase